LCHPAASRIKKQHLRDGADFIPAFLASNYSDIRLQAGRLRLKFRYKNNFAVATSIARSDRFSSYLPPHPRPQDEYRSFVATPCRNRHHHTDRHHRWLVHHPT